ncbi:MAG: EAL domain-containing protein, partial [Planctomycetota bacterium]
MSTNDQSQPVTRAPQRGAEQIRALIEGQLATCVFQPIVHVNRGEIIGYEALFRPGKDSGFSNPHELFALASELDMLDELERCSREIILQSATDWPSGTMLFMNCEPSTATKNGFASSLIQQIERIGTVPHENIVLEITERAETDDLNILLEQLRTIRASGVHIAIDDLGAGTSGLQRIMQLRPQWLKIDRELIDGIAHDQYRRNLVDVIVRFTRVSGVRLVAEGIETHDDLGVIMDMGVQHVQGYLLARPSESLSGLEGEIQAWMLGHHVQLQQKRNGPNTAFLSGIMREPFHAPEDHTVAQVREQYWTANGPVGVVLQAPDGKAVGWVNSERLMSVQFDNDPELPIRQLLEPLPETVVPSLLISEALHLLASRRNHKIAEPFLVGHEGQIIGEVGVPDLLQEAARLTGDIDGYYTQISGLPGRVQCERQLDSMLLRGQGVCTMFIDIIGFHTYNDQFGYEVGDL